MPQYTKKAQVLFTEEQYLTLLSIAQEKKKALGTLLREAADLVYLTKQRSRDKARAVRELLALKPTEVPADYHEWERDYFDERTTRHG